tara:strand:+ start:6923 stop:7123 length:201 start_codon:yes stop_codon:yes gene_type:complete
MEDVRVLVNKINWTDKLLELRYNCDMDDEQIIQHLKKKYNLTDDACETILEQVQLDLEEGSAENNA